MENFIFCAVQNMLIKVKFSANQNTKLCFFYAECNRAIFKK